MSSRTLRLVCWSSLAFGLWGLALIIHRPGVSAAVTAAEANEARIDMLLKERHATLMAVVESTTALYRNRQATQLEVSEANLAAQRAELELCKTKAERIAVLQKMVAEFQTEEKIARAAYEAARATRIPLLQAQANRLEIEVALERAKAE